MAKSKVKEPFNKYVYYERAVQNPQNEVDFFNEKYSEIRNKKAKYEYIYRF